MSLKIKFDSMGFPMVWFSAVGGYVHWLPLTKIQVEYFLSVTNEASFDETWYNRLISLNPRISPGQARASNYGQLFATGILPREGYRVAMWCGRSYDLMTAQEWLEVFQEASSQTPLADTRALIASDQTSERAKTLIEAVERATNGQNNNKRTLAQQMLLQGGTMEYVYETSDRTTFAGLGEAQRELMSSFRRPDTLEPLRNNTEGTRMRHYGLRLIHRGEMSDGR